MSSSGKIRLGYAYSLAPIHPGGEGDLGNILDIVREVHTNFPYVPGSSLRGSLRAEVTSSFGQTTADLLFGQELDTASGTMGVHQVWFGDARLLWVPMRTMCLKGGADIFTWVSCPTLIRDHALLRGHALQGAWPNQAVGTVPAGTYLVADAEVTVAQLPQTLQPAIQLSAWPAELSSYQVTWNSSCIVLPDADFQVLLEHALWTQIRNKIAKEESEKASEGAAEIFWTDVCIPRDTIFYYPWGYASQNSIPNSIHANLLDVLQGLFQLGGQGNVGRGWLQGWVADDTPPKPAPETTSVDPVSSPVEVAVEA